MASNISTSSSLASKFIVFTLGVFVAGPALIIFAANLLLEQTGSHLHVPHNSLTYLAIGLLTLLNSRVYTLRV